MRTRVVKLPIVIAALCAGLLTVTAHANETLKIGLSLPLSGPGANWGRGNEWMCHKASQEINDAGGVHVNGKTYDLKCIAYDNKYTSSEGIKVAQTLINRDNIKYLFVFGTPPLLATQPLAEREGVLLFDGSWALNTKGPKFPMTFSCENSPFEMGPAMISYVTTAHPQAKTVVMLNVNDASGQDTARVLRSAMEKKGLKVLASDFVERSTTEFQPIAARLFSKKPDIVLLGSIPPASAGEVWKELDILGFKGVKILANGDSIQGIVATAGQAANGVYMGGAVPFDGSSATPYQRKVNDEESAAIGEALGFSSIGAYDFVNIVKAALEKAQSLDPRKLAAIMPTVKFHTFYGGETGFGGKEIYGSVQQTILPVYITQIVNGKLVEKARVMPSD